MISTFNVKNLLHLSPLNILKVIVFLMNKWGAGWGEREEKKRTKAIKLCLRKKKSSPNHNAYELPHLQCKHVNKYKVSLRECFPLLI